MELKPAEIKKRVIGGTNVKWGPAGLFVGEYDGEMWATNKYWATRANRVAPLLTQYNLSADQPGSYEVNGTVRPATGTVKGIPEQGPNLAAFLGAQRDYQPGIRVRIAGQDAYTSTDGGAWLAAYLLADGTHAGLETGTLAWLSDTLTVPLPQPDDGTHFYFKPASVLFHKSESTGVSAVIRAEVVHVLERSHYADEGRGDLVPAVEETAAPMMLGLMMGMNYGA